MIYKQPCEPLSSKLYPTYATNTGNGNRLHPSYTHRLHYNTRNLDPGRATSLGTPALALQFSPRRNRMESGSHILKTVAIPH